MIRHLVRGATLLLLLALAGAYLALQEIRFVVAAAAIGCLVEIGLALRARRDRPAAAADFSRFEAARVSCTEQDHALGVALLGEGQAGRAAPYLLLSRTLHPRPEAAARGDDGPYLELSVPARSVRGGIRDAYLSPRLLRVTLDARGAQALGTGEACVTLPAGVDQRRLERTLGRILRGVAFVSERSMPEEAPEPEPLPGVLP
jgi:hypothetical protein